MNADKNISQKWFDGEVAEKINVHDKLFKKHKKSNFIDKEIYKIAQYKVQKLISMFQLVNIKRFGRL